MIRGLVGIRNELEGLGAWSTLERVCARHGARPKAVLGFRDRKPTTRRARREFVCLLVDTLALSFPEAAEIFGVDQSTIGWHVRARQKELAASPPRPLLQLVRSGGGT